MTDQPPEGRTVPHMTSEPTRQTQFRRMLVLLMVVAVSAAFLAVVRNFILAVFLAAVISTMLHPLYRRVLTICGSRRGLASGLVLAGFILAVGIPLLLFMGLVASEAVAVTKTAGPWIQEHLQDPVNLYLPDWFPFASTLEPYRVHILDRLGEASSSAGDFLFSSFAVATRGTIDFFINLFVFLYAMFFFLMRGEELFHSALLYLPLGSSDRKEVVDKGLAVTRATLKSILIIGLLQGVLVGLAFWVVGIEGAAFWATVILVLSAIPALGTPIIWGPAAVWLMLDGQIAEGIGLAVWGTFVVGLVDNILRPRIVGEETRLPDLVILVSILGGIGAFGAVGIIVGPILAAVFFVILDVYRATFADILPGGADGPD